MQLTLGVIRWTSLGSTGRITPITECPAPSCAVVLEERNHVSIIGQCNVEQVKRYIANQAEHHKRMTFQNEFREICERHDINID